jgi:hypothetical protein
MAQVVVILPSKWEALSSDLSTTKEGTDSTFVVQLSHLEKWQNNLFPSYQFGFVVLRGNPGILFLGT